MFTEIPESIRERLARQITLIGEEKALLLLNSSVCLIGLGGVGGYVAEMLARAGVGKLVLVDHDTVSVSNLNRQIIALHSTVGMKKTDALKDRIADIAPEAQVITFDTFVTSENADALLESADCGIVVDAIDNVSAKVALALSAKNRGLYIFSSLGTGNKLDIGGYRITDISKTHTCGLARAVRRELRNVGIDHLDVLFSEEQPVRIGERTPASICYMPSAAGLMIAEHIIKRIIGS